MNENDFLNYNYSLHLYIWLWKCSIRTMFVEVILHGSGYDADYGGPIIDCVQLKPTVSHDTEHRCDSFQEMLIAKPILVYISTSV